MAVDLSSALRRVVAAARSAGLHEGADEFELRCFAAVTTSSEWLGEVGLAIKGFLKRERGHMPEALEQRLHQCLAEVRKTWPHL
jgi:hypothetical protein